MKKKKILILVLVVVLIVISAVTVTYIANRKNTNANKAATKTVNITKGVTMTYKASSNVVNIGDTFDFTVEGQINASQVLDWETALKSDTAVNEKDLNISLTKLDETGTETNISNYSSYLVADYKNIYTGRPANMMGLFEEEATKSFSTKYRLKIKFNETHTNYAKPPKFKVNVYGKLVDNKGETATSFLVSKANKEDLDYNSATTDQKNQMWTFSHETTEQLGKTTDYRYIGTDPNNYVSFNNELWRIIGVFDVDDLLMNTIGGLIGLKV